MRVGIGSAVTSQGTRPAEGSLGSKATTLFWPDFGYRKMQMLYSMKL